jgi:ribosomal protein S16
MYCISCIIINQLPLSMHINFSYFRVLVPLVKVDKKVAISFGSERCTGHTNNNNTDRLILIDSQTYCDCVSINSVGCYDPASLEVRAKVLNGISYEWWSSRFALGCLMPSDRHRWLGGIQNARLRGGTGVCWWIRHAMQVRGGCLLHSERGWPRSFPTLRTSCACVQSWISKLEV